MLRQAAGCARAAWKLHCATSLRRVRACIAQPYGQRRTAVTVERMTSPYVQNLVALATRGGDGEGSGGGGSNQLIYQSFITWGGRGGWGCQTLIHQSLVPSKLSSQSLCFAKQTQGSPYQLPFVKKTKHQTKQKPQNQTTKQGTVHNEEADRWRIVTLGASGMLLGTATTDHRGRSGRAFFFARVEALCVQVLPRFC